MPDFNKVTKVNEQIMLNELTYLGLYKTLSNILPYTSERIPAQYKKMRMYPMCWLGLNFIKLGLATVPPIFEGDDDNYERTITEAVFKRFWIKLVNEALEQLDFGWKPFEILWEHGKVNYQIDNETTGEKEKRIFEGLLLKSPKGLDPETVRIITDPINGNFAGFEQYGVAEKILKEQHKALMFTNCLESGNFYGISAMEPAYPYWFDANINRQFHMRWLERKGVGILKGLYPPGNSDIGSAEKDNQDIMLDLLSSVIEGRVVSIPSKRDEHGQLVWDIEFLNDADKTDPFINRAKYIDECILRAFVIPEKALTQGEIGARASVEAYQDIFVARKEQLLDEIISRIDTELVQPFVQYNFGSDVEIHVSSGEFSDKSKDAAGRLIEKLIEQGKLKVQTQWLIDKTSIPVEEPEVSEIPGIDENNLLPDEANKDNHFVDLNKMGANIAQNNAKANIVQDDKAQKMSESGHWRVFNKLENKYRLSEVEDFLDTKSIQFESDLKDNLLSQQERIATFIKNNYTSDAKFVSVVKEVEIRRPAIKRIFKDYLNDVYDNVYSKIKTGIEDKISMASTDTPNQFIDFRVDLAAEKFASDYENAIKYQLSSDFGSGLSESEILDRLAAMTEGFLTDAKLATIADTEMGFILGKTIEDYIKENKALIKSGDLEPEKEIQRVMASAIMDKKVCDLCKKLDGTVVNVDSAIRLKYDFPIHFNCRCAWLPVTEQDINDPEINITNDEGSKVLDLTLGRKNKPMTTDELTASLGDYLKLKLFSDCDCKGVHK